MIAVVRMDSTGLYTRRDRCQETIDFVPYLAGVGGRGLFGGGPGHGGITGGAGPLKL